MSVVDALKLRVSSAVSERVAVDDAVPSCVFAVRDTEGVRSGVPEPDVVNVSVVVIVTTAVNVCEEE